MASTRDWVLGALRRAARVARLAWRPAQGSRVVPEEKASPWYKGPVPLVLGLAFALTATGVGLGALNAFGAAPATASPEATPPLTESPKTALDLLDGLVVVEAQDQKRGFAASRFGVKDTDGNGCDTRNDVLRRDLTKTVFRSGTNCVVVSGTLLSPYSGIVFLGVKADAVAVDNVVSLSDAWQTGADEWDDSRRTEFANDPLNLQAIEPGVYKSKAGGDASTWLPPRVRYRCEYVSRQIATKTKYGLWVKPDEREAMLGVLTTCRGQTVSAESPWPPLLPLNTATATPSSTPTLQVTSRPKASKVPTKKPSKTVTTSAKPSVSVPPTTPTQQVVVKGAACLVPGQLGVTAKGDPMICKEALGRLKWRAL